MKPVLDTANVSSAPVKGVNMDLAKKQKLQKAAKEFESMFVAYMLKTMRKSIPETDLMGEKFGGDMMEGMFDLELSKHVSQSGSLGIARSLYKKITGEELDALPASLSAAQQPLKKQTMLSRPIVKQVKCGSPLSEALPHGRKLESIVEPIKSRSSISESIATGAKLDTNIEKGQSTVLNSGSVVPKRKQETVVEPVKSHSPLAENPVRAPKQEVIRPEKSAGVRTEPAKKSVLFQPSRSLTERLSEIQSMIDTAAHQHGVDSTLVKAVIASESAGKSNVSSSKNAKGLMQLIDSTAAEMGVQNVWDPQENIQGGVKYLKQMLERCNGDVRLALASYNAGPGAVEKHGGIPPFKETREYVNKVMNYLQFFQQQEVPKK